MFHKVHRIRGQPAMFTVLIPRALPTPTQSVGFGWADGTLPKAAQLPIQIVAAALEVTSFASSRPVLPFGPRVRYFPLHPSGTGAFHNAINLPGNHGGTFPDSVPPDSRQPPSTFHDIPAIWYRAGYQPHWDRKTSARLTATRAFGKLQPHDGRRLKFQQLGPPWV